MVDARLPAEWLGSLRIDKLSDRAFRVLAGALMWCNGQGTDGAVPARYTKYLHPDGDDQGAFDELETAGLWCRVADGYLLVGWAEDLHQSTAEEIHRYRDAAKRRQQAYRDRQRGQNLESDRATAQGPGAIRDVTRNATRDVTANVGSGGYLGPLRGVRACQNSTRSPPEHDRRLGMGLRHRRPQARCRRHLRGVRLPSRPRRVGQKPECRVLGGSASWGTANACAAGVA